MRKWILVAIGCLMSAAAGSAEEHQVAVKNFVFEPADLQIQVGDTVTWTNEGGLHNVAAPGLFRCANGCDGEGGNGEPASNAWSFSLTFNTQQEIDYVCEVHAGIGMVGSISVVAGGGLSLAVGGACPGELTVGVAGGTPNGQVALIFAPELGSTPIPSGSCAGTLTGLSSPRLLARLNLDGSGAGSVGGTVGAQACGIHLQAVDLGDCSVSNTAETPGGD